MIQKKKFVKTFRNTKTVQLVLLLLLEAALCSGADPEPCVWARSFSKTGPCLFYAHFPGSLLYLI